MIKATTDKADKLFSVFIRDRDGKCVRCGRAEQLQNSHFWGRGNSAVRYDPDNCDTLCYACHYGNAQGWEYNKQGAYREFKIKQLGMKKYKELEARANSVMPRTQAIKECMELLGYQQVRVGHFAKIKES